MKEILKKPEEVATVFKLMLRVASKLLNGMIVSMFK